jgi:hypothetical protein
MHESLRRGVSPSLERTSELRSEGLQVIIKPSSGILEERAKKSGQEDFVGTAVHFGETLQWAAFGVLWSPGQCMDRCAASIE